MHVHGGIVANTEISYEMNLGIPQPDKDVVLPPRSFWYDIFRAELSDVASPIYRLKFDLVITA
jgi:hypothetical protein